MYWQNPKRRTIYVKNAISKTVADKPPIEVEILVIVVSITVVITMIITTTKIPTLAVLLGIIIYYPITLSINLGIRMKNDTILNVAARMLVVLSSFTPLIKIFLILG
jgi:hypothetical protein